MRAKEIPVEQIRLNVRAVARFWAKVQVGKPRECWPWMGAVGTAKGHGYGVWNFVDVPYKAHRVAYSLKVGAIPEGLTLDHRCENKLCCNPKHLEPVTQSENTKRQYSSENRLYSLVCSRGHAKIFGDRNCRRCSVIAVAASQAKRPEYYREMKRLQKQKERARKFGEEHVAG